ncbi:ACT domain-containing protein [Zongyangia hominis]|uniref:Acetolactate synthase n=1 Tax=Zongyangia hominis TaxID=2763677 RepID=A0A926EES6_9FIRM|nr:ACT domain-containing protein [Zongyangia hominis]MBC8571129.1 acetolactate synthase [Zongyangia hominis]
MVVKQLSVFIENKSGRLVQITEILGKNKIDIRAVSIADTTSFGILRLIVDDPDRAKSVLREAGFTVSITEVIAIAIEDEPGGLSKALRVLSNAQIGVEYMYAFLSKEDKTAYVILRVEDNDEAARVLQAAGIKCLSSEDICNI